VEALKLRREWEQRHLDRAYDYVAVTEQPSSRHVRNARKQREQRAAHSLTMRLLIDVILLTQAATMDGDLDGVSIADMSAAVEQMAVCLIDSLA
jgi:hypothetical protein